MTETVSSHSFRHRVKHSNATWAIAARQVVNWIRYGQLPIIPGLHTGLCWLHRSLAACWQTFIQKTYYSPLFRSQLVSSPKALYLYSGMPQIAGPLALSLGDHCRVSGISSFFGRAAGVHQPSCRIGNNVDIGWQCTLAVGRRIELHDNVRLAGRCYLAGFPGHPEDPLKRADGHPETESQVGDIVLHENVWLATGVTVLAGVTIGANTIVGAGSVVTRDLPPNVVAAGNPARVIRPIRCDDRLEVSS